MYGANHLAKFPIYLYFFTSVFRDNIFNEKCGNNGNVGTDISIKTPSFLLLVEYTILIIIIQCCIVLSFTQYAYKSFGKTPFHLCF